MSDDCPTLTRRADVLLILAVICATSCLSPVYALTKKSRTALPKLDPAFPPLAAENEPLLLDRLMEAFGRDYSSQYIANMDRNLSDGLTVYYLRQELQSLLDMWRASGKIAYLDLASNLTEQAIAAAMANRRPLILRSDDYRGEWPCFYLETVQAQTGGHNQLCDFQGCAGFLNVARAMQQINRPGWDRIADFVEQQVVEKWLYHKPSITEAHLTGPKTFSNLLAVLNAGRDVREHFACICLDLYRMGYRRYPYWDWARLLIDLYLTPRYDPNWPAPHEDEIPNHIPQNWGLFVHTAEAGYVWLSVPNADPDIWDEPMDTSHANRTVWLATRAYSEGFIDKSIVEGLINTFRFRIWAPEKGPFYFNNYIDGSDGEMNGLSGGRGGNIWFGWHRLAAYDETLEDLFLSIAYDLTDGGPNLPYRAQNKAMPNACTCLEAWGARLLSAKGQRYRFP